MNEFSIRTPQQLGAVLRGWRKDLELNQKDVGLKVGLAQKAVSQIETAPGRTSLARIFRVLAALELEIVVRPRRGEARRSEW